MKSVREGYLQNKRILVVEDQVDILQAYIDILSPKAQTVKLKSSRSRKANSTEPAMDETSDGFEVVAVSTGEAALEEVKKAQAANKPFAMGFFDVLLGPGMDGIETVKRVHELDSEMYAILVTAYQD